MGSSKQTQKFNNTITNSAWAPAEPYLQSGVQGLGDWMSGAGATSYQGPRVADLSAQTQTGVDRLMASPGANTSANYYNDVLSGRWLDQGNPYMERLQDAVRASVMPSINSQFSANGLFGSSAHQGTIARELGRSMAEPLFAAYENERNRQQQAAGQLPSVDQIISGNYLQAGNIMDRYSQALVDANRQQWEEDRAAPVRGITEAMPLLNQIGSQYGTQNSSGTSVSRSSPSLGQQIAGGALMGLSALAAPATGGASLGLGSSIGATLFNGLGNMMQGAPFSYGSSWAPWVQRA